MRADGYGVIGRHGLAHRHVWTECFGEIPPRAVVHHVCENPSCVNPSHLRLVGSQAAHARMHGHIVTAQAASRAATLARTHCKRGHEFTIANTYRTRDGRRSCRACHAADMRARRAAVSNPCGQLDNPRERTL